MSDTSGTNRQTGPVRRVPDCVTEVRKGDYTLVVSGYFKQDATETATDKMARFLAAEGTFHPQNG